MRGKKVPPSPHGPRRRLIKPACCVRSSFSFTSNLAHRYGCQHRTAVPEPAVRWWMLYS
ncbi:hypothetical protein OH77DRAFT_1418245 [Trametes cingulata]|nr:hypothetical protein OH77DRAFT_1418245 [Trametes cingulata]